MAFINHYFLMPKIPIQIVSTNRNRVSILAFYIYLVKLSKNHGRIEHFTYRKAMSLTGLSENTLRKHIKDLDRLGWAYFKDGHLNFVAQRKIAKKEYVSRRIKVEVAGSTFKEIRESLDEQIILHKLKQCQYVIDQKTTILNNRKGDYKKLKKFLRHCRQRGYRVEDFNGKLQISLRRLAYLFGWSVSKIHAILKRLVYKDLIKKISFTPTFLGIADYSTPDLEYGVFIHHGIMYKSVPCEYKLLTGL